MGIALLDNFNVDDVAALPVRGYELSNVAWVTTGLATFQDNGVTRTALELNFNVAQAGGAVIAQMFKIPIPSSLSAYVSFRMRALNPLNSATLPTDFSMGLATRLTGGNSTVLWQWRNARVSTTSSTLTNAPNGPGYNRGWGSWFKVEIFRASSGALQVWVDDFILTTPIASSLAPSDNFLYLLGARSAVRTGIAQVQITDLVVVDPATPGMSYRPGAKAHVADVPFTADTIAQWVPNVGVTAPHHQIVKSFPSVPTAEHTLTATAVGQREQYQAAAIPAVFGTKVLALAADMLVQNQGGMNTTLAVEVDTGSGITEIGSVTLPPASGYLFRQVVSEAKPGGGSWSSADVLATKAGYSIKS